MTLDPEETICGIATGQVASCRGAIRVSGRDCLAVVQQAMALPEIRWDTRRATRTRQAWFLGDDFGEIDVDVWVWPTTRSYTGLPSIELHTLGQPILLDRIVEQLCQAGARLARPGEFTLRAFLAGRMDLTQCEAVLGVIEARSETAFQTALIQLAGGLSSPLSELRKKLIELLADIEAGLDFVDEDIEFISSRAIEENLLEAHAKVSALLGQIQHRELRQEGARIVLVGLPNAGKSSLLNALTGYDHAIVHDQAGTTRDFLRVRAPFAQGDVVWIDTAGIEAIPSVLPEQSDIAQAAQNQRHQQSMQADLILHCTDAAAASPEPLITTPLGTTWRIWTKCDHGNLRVAVASVESSERSFCTSSHRRLGLDELRYAIEGWLAERHHEETGVVPLTATRCAAHLSATSEALEAARKAAEHGLGHELVASELRYALDQLGQVAGTVHTDDVLDALFHRFCIGK